MVLKSIWIITVMLTLSLLSVAGPAEDRRAAEKAVEGLSKVEHFGETPSSCSVDSINYLAEGTDPSLSTVKNGPACQNLYNFVCDSKKQIDRKKHSKIMRDFYYYKAMLGKMPNESDKKEILALLSVYASKKENEGVDFDQYAKQNASPALYQRMGDFLVSPEASPLNLEKEIMAEILNPQSHEMKVASEIFGNIKKSMLEVLEQKKNALKLKGKDDKLIDQTFAVLEDSVKNVEFSSVGAENVCFLGQKNAYVQRSSSKQIVTLCPATLLGSADEIAGTFANVLGSAIDSCSINSARINDGETNAHPTLFEEPLRGCLAEKTSATKIPILSFNGLVDPKKRAAIDKQSDQFEFRSDKEDGSAFCAKPLCAGDLKDPHAKLRDQSNDAVQKYWGGLAVAQYAKTGAKSQEAIADSLAFACDSKYQKKSYQVDIQKFYNQVLLKEPSFLSAMGCTQANSAAVLAQSCSKKLENGLSELSRYVSYRMVNASSQNAPNAPNAPKKPSKPSSVSDFTVEGTNGEGVSNPAPKPRGDSVGSSELVSLNRTDLEKRNAALKKALNGFNSRCMSIFDHHNTPFQDSELKNWCGKKEGYVRVDLSDQIPGDVYSESDGFNFQLGCNTMCMCNELECHYPEAFLISDVNPNKTVKTYNYGKDGKVNAAAVKADLDMLMDGDEKNRYKNLAKSCFLANPDLSVGSAWHKEACSKTNGKTLVEQTRKIQIAGSLSKAIFDFSCHINCNCGEGASCRAETTHDDPTLVVSGDEQMIAMNSVYFAANVKRSNNAGKGKKLDNLGSKISAAATTVAGNEQTTTAPATPPGNDGVIDLDTPDEKAKLHEEAQLKALNRLPKAVPKTKKGPIKVTILKPQKAVVKTFAYPEAIENNAPDSKSKPVSKSEPVSKPAPKKDITKDQIVADLESDFEELKKHYPNERIGIQNKPEAIPVEQWDKNLAVIQALSDSEKCVQDLNLAPVFGSEFVKSKELRGQGYMVRYVAEFDCVSSRKQLLGYRPYFDGPMLVESEDPLLPKNFCKKVQFLEDADPFLGSSDGEMQYIRTPKEIVKALRADKSEKGKPLYERILRIDIRGRTNECTYSCRKDFCLYTNGKILKDKPVAKKSDNPSVIDSKPAIPPAPKDSDNKIIVDKAVIAAKRKAVAEKMAELVDQMNANSKPFEWKSEYSKDMNISRIEYNRIKSYIDQAVKSNTTACANGSVEDVFIGPIQSSDTPNKDGRFLSTYSMIPSCVQDKLVGAAEVHVKWYPTLNVKKGCGFFAFFDDKQANDYSKEHIFFQHSTDVSKLLRGNQARCQDGAPTFKTDLDGKAIAGCHYTCFCDTGLCSLSNL